MADTNDQTGEETAAEQAEAASEESLEDSSGSGSGGQTPAADQPAGENAESSADTGSGGKSESSSADGVIDAGGGSASSTPSAPAPPKRKRFSTLRRYVNVYTLMFVFVLLIAGAVALVAYRQGHKPTTDHLNTQGLSQSALEQLANSDVNVGSNNTVLNVKSSAVFAGQVLIRQNLEVGGNLQISGTVALNNITINGTSQLGTVNVNKNLAVAGDSALQGSATIGKSLQVGGGATFNGPISAPQITTSKLQLNGDLTLTHHISVGGGQPSRNSGPALGGGGSASVSGSDTAGYVAINTGNGPAAGCFVTVNFTSGYNQTPYVMVTPVGSAAGGLHYYISRSTSGFSICDSSTPPSGSSFGFDYFVVD